MEAIMSKACSLTCYKGSVRRAKQGRRAQRFAADARFNLNRLSVKTSDKLLTGQAGLAAAGPLLKMSGLNDFKASTTTNNPEYTDADCMKVLIASMLNGNSTYVYTERLRGQNDFTTLSLQLVGGVPSCETVRQRLDEIAKDPCAIPYIFNCMEKMLDKNDYQPPLVELTYKDKRGGISYKNVVVNYIDNSIMVNANCHKEGVNYTYKKGVKGYNPVFAYDSAMMPVIGELLEGNAPALYEGIYGIFDKIKQVQDNRFHRKTQLTIFDCAYDSIKHMSYIEDQGGLFITRLNNRGNSFYEIQAVNLASSENPQIKENQSITTEKDGTRVIVGDFVRTRVIGKNKKRPYRYVYEVKRIPNYESGSLKWDVKVFMVWTNIFGVDSEEILKLYRQRGESEQMFGEIKTDMRHEKFPSGSLATNQLIFALMLFSQAMLRIMGTYLVKCTINGEITDVERRRIGTVIQHFMHMPGILIKHARHWVLRVHSYFHEVAEALCQFYTDMCMLT